jgi:hypothetical protein
MSRDQQRMGVAGIEQAVRRGDAFGGMVLINEGLD